MKEQLDLLRIGDAAQADFLSPMKTARGMGLRPTNHTDFTVEPGAIKDIHVVETIKEGRTVWGRKLGPIGSPRR